MNVSEERGISIFSIEEQARQETTISQEAMQSFDFQRTARRNIPEDRILGLKFV
jgi:hypothetical protein